MRIIIVQVISRFVAATTGSVSSATFRISLPIVSNFTSTNAVNGTVILNEPTTPMNMVTYCNADTTNEQIYCNVAFPSVDTGKSIDIVECILLRDMVV